LRGLKRGVISSPPQKKIDSPKGIDVKGDLNDLESILKKHYLNVDYSKIEKIVNRVYGK
tara:strand:- start:358 stop:534 length:177 start_codon:yes stop_codon:yes gene_type:complete